MNRLAIALLCAVTAVSAPAKSSHGRDEGTRMLRWPNGHVRIVETFHQGVLEGKLREWLPDGTLFREQNYRHGQEEGRQRMWYADGTLRANYVVKSGRRFGLMGAKGCTGKEHGTT